MSLVLAGSYSDSFNYCEMTSTWWHLNSFIVVFYRASACNTYRARYCYGKSVCLSVCVSVCLSVSLCVCLRPVSVLCLNECTRDISLHLFDALLAPHSSFSELNRRYNIKGVSWIFFHWGPRAKGWRPRAGVWFLGRGQQPPPHQLGGLGSTVSSPSGVSAELRPPKGFPIIRMTSPRSGGSVLLGDLIGVSRSR